MSKNKKKGRSLNKIQQWIVTILLGATVIAVLIAAVLRVISSAKSAYDQAVEEQRSKTYQKFYQTAYDIGEKRNHVSNDVAIVIERVREEELLEVLQVSDIEYVFQEGNVKIWTSVCGHGVYTVDLKLGEFVVDNERRYVLIRIPKPCLNTAGLDYIYHNYLFEDGLFNGTTSEGIDLAREDLKTAQRNLQRKLASTQDYYEMAEKSAEELLIDIVRNWNPEVPDLFVEVEFME